MKTIIDILNDWLDNAYSTSSLGGGIDDTRTDEDRMKQYDDYQDQALKEIEELILESLPEKRTLPRVAEDTPENISDFMHYIGYNQALSDTKANLLKILGGESEV